MPLRKEVQVRSMRDVSERLTPLLRWSFLAFLSIALIFYIGRTLHWPMMVNAPVMHYVVFLMRHGLRPYRDITDMNMPGAYLMEGFGMAIFGGGDLGWRLYDFFLLAVLMASMVAIARPYDWLAGVYAAGLFALRHGSEGPWFAGEREQEMTVLIAVSCALLFVAVRRERPGLCLVFGLCAGLAASVKPTLAPFGALCLFILWFVLRRRALKPLPYLLWSLAGLIVPLAASLLFLFHYRAFGSFLFVLRAVTPIYASLNDPGWRFLVVHAAPREWLPLFLLGTLALLVRRRWDWERWVILLAATCGLVSYFVQQKGFWYQRYMFLAFALLLVAMEVLPSATPSRSWLRWLGLASLAYASLYLLPRYCRTFSRLPATSPLTLAMEEDLRTLGGSHLQREVQCFDITFGCLNSLYHLGLVENTGFTGDMLLFPNKLDSATAYYRGMFWSAQAVHPASVLVLTNQEFGQNNSFQRFARWPELERYLANEYRLTSTHTFPREDKGTDQIDAPPAYAPSYRIYVRKESITPPSQGFSR